MGRLLANVATSTPTLAEPNHRRLDELLRLNAGSASPFTMTFGARFGHEAYPGLATPTNSSSRLDGNHLSLGSITGFTSTTGVRSSASRGPTSNRSPSRWRTFTLCRPIGLGRSGERVLKTPWRPRLSSSSG